MAQPEHLEAQLRELPAFYWLPRLAYWAVGGFVALSAWLLVRMVKPLDAILAVAFGVGVVAALIAGLGFLAGADSS